MEYELLQRGRLRKYHIFVIINPRYLTTTKENQPMKSKRKTAKLIIGATAFGASHADPNALWATGFIAGDAFILIEHDGKTVMFVTDLEYERAKKQARRVDEIIRFEEFRKKERLEKDSEMHEVLSRYFIKHGITSIAVSLYAGVFAKLAKKFSVTVPEAGLFPARAIKRPDEIENIAALGALTESVMQSVFNAIAKMEIRNGKIFDARGLFGKKQSFLTADAVRSWMNVEFVRNEAFCPDAIIASGDQAADPHCIGFGPLRANAPIVFDIFPRSMKNLYWYDTTRTVVKGKLTPKARRLYNAVQKTQAYQLSLVKPGADNNKIHQAGKKMLEDYGYKTGLQQAMINGKTEMRIQGFFHGTGHGVGVDIHEEPRISAKKIGVLQPGMVITIEPGLYYYGIGGVRIEDTAVVTEGGHRNLATLTKELIEL
jgi:Xaa-Pro aminopeptidase